MAYQNELYHYGTLGMKWGVRRYQNKDGTLTELGKKRYTRDIDENLHRKKDNRLDTSTPDTNRWVREDRERTKKVLDTSSGLVRQLQNLEQRPTNRSKKKMNLSNMTDQEMRQQINREILERQYSDLFSSDSNINRGREIVKEVLSVGGGMLGVASSALGIALALKELKG